MGWRRRGRTLEERPEPRLEGGGERLPGRAAELPEGPEEARELGAGGLGEGGHRPGLEGGEPGAGRGELQQGEAADGGGELLRAGRGRVGGARQGLAWQLVL